MKKLIIIILLLLCLTASVSHSQSFKMFGQLPSGQFADGLVFYWRGIEAVEAVDESHYGNNGLITGATWMGNGLLFEGAEDVDLGQNAVAFGIVRHATFVTWINLTADNANYRNIIGDWYSNKGFTIRVNNDETLTFFVYPNDHRITAVGTIIPGRWHQVVGVMDGVGMFLYLDGVQIGSQVLGDAINSSGRSVFFGQRGDNAHHFEGLINNISIYTRALSASEIAALYLNPNLPMQQPPIWLLQPSVVPSGIIPIIQAHARRRRAG